MVENMKIRKTRPNWYQMKEGVKRMKMCGSDHGGSLFRREFWSLRNEEEEEEATEFSLQELKWN